MAHAHRAPLSHLGFCVAALWLGEPRTRACVWADCRSRHAHKGNACDLICFFRSGGRLVILGSNFATTGLQITIGGVPCASQPVQLNASAVMCDPARALHIGWASVVVAVNGQASAPARLLAGCTDGYYGTPADGACASCPPNAVCVGGLDPLPLPGYYRAGRTSFLACTPPEACLGGVIPPPAARAALEAAVVGANLSAGGAAVVFDVSEYCGSGYVGDRCAACADGYYRSYSKCVSCPHSAWMLILAFLVAAIVAAFLMQKIHNHRARLRGITVGVDFLQCLALFSNFKFAWPPAVSALFSVANVFTFAVQQAAPECSLPLSYFQKWLLVQLSPVILCSVTNVYYVLAIAAAVGSHKGKRHGGGATTAGAPLGQQPQHGRCGGPAVGRLVDLAVGSQFTILYYLYFAVARGGLEIFDCSTDKSGRLHLDAEPTITCWGPAHAQLVPYAVAALLLYGVGIPLTFAGVLWRHRAAMTRDVALLALGRGDNANTNPDYWVRRRYSRLYSDYDPKCVRAGGHYPRVTNWSALLCRCACAGTFTGASCS